MRSNPIFYMFIGVFIFLTIFWINLALWGGDYFDSYCIKGKLKENHITAINSVGWSKRDIEENDRVIAHECSEFLRYLHFRDVEWWKSYKDSIQKFLFGKKI